MATVSIQTKFTTDDLMNALEQLEPTETERIAKQLLQQLARRRAKNLPEREAQLLGEIYQEKRPGFQERFDTLRTKRRNSTLTETEHAELLELVTEAEAFAVHRLEALAELSRLRQVTLPRLIKQLGLKAPSVV